MRAKSVGRTAGIIVAGLVVVAVALFAWPRPIPVDLATVARGPMEVTVDDEARTRVRHIYTVSAPITGQVLRISNPQDGSGVSIHVGDDVIANETVVAVMQATAPSFIDVRLRGELEAAAAAAEAAVKLAEAEVLRIEAVLDFARSELDRAEALATTDTITERALDVAKLDVATNEAALASANAQLDVRRGEHAIAVARMIDPSNDAARSGSACCVEIRAPAGGRVLKIVQDSEGLSRQGRHC